MHNQRPPARRACALTATALLLLAGPASSAFAQAAHVNLASLDAANGQDQFIVKYRNESVAHHSSAAARQSLETSARSVAPGLRYVRRSATGADIVRVDRRLDRAAAERLMRQIASDPNVEYVEVDRLNMPQMVPNDPSYSHQWGLLGGWGIHAERAWDKGSGEGVVVAIIDTGTTNHYDLKANLLPGYDFASVPAYSGDGDGRDPDASDPGGWAIDGQCNGAPGHTSDWHGTRVAGIVAAVTNNQAGMAGVAYKAKILPVRTTGPCGAYDSDNIDGLTWASGGQVSDVPMNAHPAEVINMSGGAPGACGITYQRAIDAAVARGSTIVVSAGNSSRDIADSSPASCNNVIAVAAIDVTGRRTSFSNHGSKVDIAAPGEDVSILINGGTTTPERDAYSRTYGTSLSAPFVSGVAALIQSALKSPMTPAQVEEVIKTSARPFSPAQDYPIGAGALDATAAVEMAVWMENRLTYQAIIL